MKKFTTLVASLSLAVLSQSSFAHHSTSGIYDQTNDLELKGVVKEWKFINPHPTLKLTVTDAKGVSHDWDVSYGGSAVTHLKRRGYDATTFKIGEVITAKGKPTLAPDTYGLLMEAGTPTRADGTPVVARQAPPGGGAGGPPSN